jgi:predicted kinase
MLVGLSGSGKSTYRNMVVEDSFDTVLSTDDYIEEFARLNNKTYNEVFEEQIKDAQKRFNHDFDEAIKNGQSIVIDQTNLTVNSRRKKLARVPKDYKKIAVYFCVDHNIIFEINKQRAEFGRTLPMSVLYNQIKSLQIPTLEEGFDEVIIVDR